jgi:hypothetical protein
MEILPYGWKSYHNTIIKKWMEILPHGWKSYHMDGNITIWTEILPCGGSLEKELSENCNRYISVQYFFELCFKII